MKTLIVKTKIDTTRLFVEVPEEFVGKKVTIIITPIRSKGIDPTKERKVKESLIKNTVHLKKIYEKILENSIEAVDMVEDEPEWHKKK